MHFHSVGSYLETLKSEYMLESSEVLQKYADHESHSQRLLNIL